MNQYYNELMKLQGAEEFKNLLKKWNTLSSNLHHVPFSAPILLPDLFLVAKSGTGITNLINKLAEYLSSAGNLMEFYGDVKYFEFLLSYCAPDTPFTELKRLIDETAAAAGFRNEYKGIIHIDIDEWITHYKEKHFVSFMEYLADYSDKWLVILSVSPRSEEKIHNLEAFLSMYLRLEKISLTLPKTDDLFDYIETALVNYNLWLSPDAKELLTDTIECLRENPYFDGYKTIKYLCQDIVYHLYCESYTDLSMISADMLEDFSVDSEYVKRTIFKLKKMNTIGFGN